MTRGNTLAQGFSTRMMTVTYDKSLTDVIVNRNYEGEINGVGSVLNIMDFDKITEKDYNNAPLSVDSLSENNGKLIIDKKKSFYWAEKDYENWLSYIKDPHSKVVAQAAQERNKNMDVYVLAKYDDVAAGNRVGTDYTTGTVTVDAVTGNVTGSTTVFTAAMVGRGFKAAGHSKWYRVKSYASATSIVIEDDKDDVDSAYTGGAIGAGATYIIEAATPVAITTSNLVLQISLLKLKLDSAEKNGFNAVPQDDRFLIVPPEFETLMYRASGVVLHVPDVYTNLIQKGMVHWLLGFKVFMSNRLTGNNTDGYHIIAGHTNWMTFAEKVITARMEEDITGDFGSAFKDLFVYGGKVKDIARSQAAELFATFTLS